MKTEKERDKWSVRFVVITLVTNIFFHLATIMTKTDMESSLFIVNAIFLWGLILR